jgi:SPP1 family predicted phage head-tail adaptor
MQAGSLDRRIVLQRYSLTRDDLNNAVETWTTLATVWAEKLDISDRERVTAAQLGADITTRFRIRYSSAVAALNPKDRVLYGGRTYDVMGVKEIGRREGLELTTAARTD